MWVSHWNAPTFDANESFALVSHEKRGAASGNVADENGRARSLAGRNCAAKRCRAGRSYAKQGEAARRTAKIREAEAELGEEKRSEAKRKAERCRATPSDSPRLVWRRARSLARRWLTWRCSSRRCSAGPRYGTSPALTDTTGRCSTPCGTR